MKTITPGFRRQHIPDRESKGRDRTKQVEREREREENEREREKLAEL